MVGGGDNHGIEIFAVEQLVIFAELLGFPADLL
jgi:hypothetical protein